jgi:23S rRNA (guanosine2251-2'-O)-methyltransferase
MPDLKTVAARNQLIFGIHAVTALLAHDPSSIQQIWVARSRHDARIRSLLETAAQRGIPVFPEPSSELNRLSGGKRHQGIIAQHKDNALEKNEGDLPNILAAVQSPLLLVLDGIQDPHNLGACLRSADAAGVHAILVPADRAVGLTATVRKVACGAAETVPLLQVTNLARSLRMLQASGLWIVGADGSAKTDLYELDFTGPMAIVLGAEQKGLRHLTRQICDFLVRIPMSGNVESLNVSVATGVFLFEAVRQRRANYSAQS